MVGGDLKRIDALGVHVLHEVEEIAAVRFDRMVGEQYVLEVHEEMVTDSSKLLWLRERLQRSGIGLAYDDFGAGQARIAELAEAPPNFVKLDMSLVRGIDKASARQELMQALIRGINDLGIELIAEGIETR